MYAFFADDRDVDDLRPGAGSFGEMVCWWIEALRAGIWRFDREGGSWAYDWRRLPTGRELSGLV